MSEKTISFAYWLNRFLSKSLLDQSTWLRRLKNTLKQRYLEKHANADGSICVKIHGESMDIPIEMFDSCVSSPYEEESVRLFLSALRPGMTFIDVGAHFGYYSLIAARILGKSGHIHAFEPSPQNRALLERNVNKSGYKNIQIHSVALANAREKEKLQLTPEKGNNSLVRTNKTQDFVEVETIPFDQCLPEAQPDIIKMDIEGGEPRALAGMNRTISKAKNLVLLIEWNPARLRDAGLHPEDLWSILKGHKFQIWVVDDAHTKLHTYPLNQFRKEYDLQAIYKEPSRIFNLYCVKGKGEKPQ